MASRPPSRPITDFFKPFTDSQHKRALAADNSSSGMAVVVVLDQRPLCRSTINYASIITTNSCHDKLGLITLVKARHETTAMAIS